MGEFLAVECSGSERRPTSCDQIDEQYYDRQDQQQVDESA
jgi:hypothetical protein